MPETQYRLFFDNEPASRATLDRFEEATVEQALTRAWHAKLLMPVCVDEKGIWPEEAADVLRSFARLRLEVRQGGKAFVPLIDGPVVGVDHDLDPEPGRSRVVVNVMDDSVFLNREEDYRIFERMRADEIAAELFRGVPHVERTEVDPTPAPPPGPRQDEVQRGTAMDLLRRLAKRHDRFVYVRPGADPGASVGVFKAPPKQPGELPPLVLLGSWRNLKRFQVDGDDQRPARVEGVTLNPADKSIRRVGARLGDVDLLGSDSPFADEAKLARRLLSPARDERVPAQDAAQAIAAESSYSIRGSGETLGPCYDGVLTPFQVVTVQGANGRQSGRYLVSEVTHRLSRSEYTQAFVLLRNARSSGAAKSAGPLGAIF